MNQKSNADLDDDIQPRLRIGISLGEVVIADNTITGAGVVLAQRLEQLAEPDGVIVQGSVTETVPTRLPFAFESLGEQMVQVDHSRSGTGYRFLETIRQYLRRRLIESGEAEHVQTRHLEHFVELAERCAPVMSFRDSAQLLAGGNPITWTV